MLGDLFQQYAAKYIGISRGIPLSNTNQLWGLAWGALVFGELSGIGLTAQVLVIAGSVVMILGAAAISLAEAPVSEQDSWRKAMHRECSRYGLETERVAAMMQGEEEGSRSQSQRRWWEWLVMSAAVAIFVWLGSGAERQKHFDEPGLDGIVNCCHLGFPGCVDSLLWRRTRFS